MKQTKVVMILEHDLEKPTLDRRVYKEAKSLINSGYEVNIITWNLRSRKNKIEQYYKEKIKIIRIHQQMNAKFNQLIKKIRAFYEINLKTIKIIEQIKPDIIHCHDINPLIAGAISKKKTNAKLIYDTHEIHTRKEEKKIIKIAYSIIERILIPKSSLVIVANEVRRNYMKKKYKIKNIMAINNYPKLKKEKITKHQEEDVIFLYQGGISKYRGIDNILKALTRVRGKFKFYFYGFGPETEKYKKRIKKLKLKKRVFIKKPINIEKLFHIMKKVDVGVLSLLNTSLNNYYCAPNKLYDYMRSGNAILGPKFPHMIEEIEKEGVGKCCDFESVQSIQQAIEWFIKNRTDIDKMKERSIRLHLKKFNWEQEEKKLIQAYKELKED